MTKLQRSWRELAGAAKMGSWMWFLTPKTWQKKLRKLIIFTVNGRNSYFLLLWKKATCVSFAGQMWRQQSGTMWKDTSLRVTKATMLTTNQVASCGHKKQYSSWFVKRVCQWLVKMGNFFYDIWKVIIWIFILTIGEINRNKVLNIDMICFPPCYVIVDNYCEKSLT